MEKVLKASSLGLDIRLLFVSVNTLAYTQIPSYTIRTLNVKARNQSGPFQCGYSNQSSIINTIYKLIKFHITLRLTNALITDEAVLVVISSFLFKQENMKSFHDVTDFPNMKWICTTEYFQSDRMLLDITFQL